MALNAVQIAREISALAVEGVNVRDLSSIPQAVTDRDLPVIYPKPDGWMSDLLLRVDSYGSSSGKKTVFYTLTYRYLHSPVGSGRGLFDVYDSMVTHALAFVDAIIANDALAGLVDIQPVAFPNWSSGIVDPSGAQFHGADISLRVTEYVN